MALVLNLAPSHMRSSFTAWSVLVGNVFNLIVAVQVVGFLSDWFGGRTGGCALAALGVAGARSDGVLGELALLCRRAHRGAGDGPRRQLLERLSRAKAAWESRLTSSDARCWACSRSWPR